jgi:hypothetical protein
MRYVFPCRPRCGITATRSVVVDHKVDVVGRAVWEFRGPRPFIFTKVSARRGPRAQSGAQPEARLDSPGSRSQRRAPGRFSVPAMREWSWGLPARHVAVRRRSRCVGPAYVGSVHVDQQRLPIACDWISVVARGAYCPCAGARLLGTDVTEAELWRTSDGVKTAILRSVSHRPRLDSLGRQTPSSYAHWVKAISREGRLWLMCGRRLDATFASAIGAP